MSCFPAEIFSEVWSYNFDNATNKFSVADLAVISPQGTESDAIQFVSPLYPISFNGAAHILLTHPNAVELYLLSRCRSHKQNMISVNSRSSMISRLFHLILECIYIRNDLWDWLIWTISFTYKYRISTTGALLEIKYTGTLYTCWLSSSLSSIILDLSRSIVKTTPRDSCGVG